MYSSAALGFVCVANSAGFAAHLIQRHGIHRSTDDDLSAELQQNGTTYKTQTSTDSVDSYAVPGLLCVTSPAKLLARLATHA